DLTRIEITLPQAVPFAARIQQVDMTTGISGHALERHDAGAAGDLLVPVLFHEGGMAEDQRLAEHSTGLDTLGHAVLADFDSLALVGTLEHREAAGNRYRRIHQRQMQAHRAGVLPLG